VATFTHVYIICRFHQRSKTSDLGSNCWMNRCSFEQSDKCHSKKMKGAIGKNSIINNSIVLPLIKFLLGWDRYEKWRSRKFPCYSDRGILSILRVGLLRP
jgi:hypothetical protein